MHIVNKVELVYRSIVGSPIGRNPSHLFGRGSGLVSRRSPAKIREIFKESHKILGLRPELI
jgi:hypothetical protein